MPANRYDLLSVEGLIQAFAVFLGLKDQPKVIKVEDASQTEFAITIKKEVLAVRP